MSCTQKDARSACRVAPVSVANMHERKGDNGTTTIKTGIFLPKSNLRFFVIGDIEELNALLGIILSQSSKDAWYNSRLEHIQHRLLDVVDELNHISKHVINEADVEYLEEAIDEFRERFKLTKDTIVPSGPPTAVRFHLARAVCRRAERHAVAIQNDFAETNPLTLVYLNRLGDVLCAYARVANRGKDMKWEPKQVEPSVPHQDPVPGPYVPEDFETSLSRGS